MAALNTPFDPNAHEEMQDRSPVPAGEYMAHIVASEMKNTKTSGGQYLQLEFQIDTPQFTDRKLWARLNLVNANATAVEIAQRELTSICLAVGITQAINDSNDLHGKPLIVKVKINPASGDYAPSNSITAYKKAGNMGATGPTEGTTPAGATTPETPAATKPAWAT